MAAVAEVLDEAEEGVGLADAEGGGGLVHEEDFGVEGDGFGGGNHLALAAGHALDFEPGGADIDVQPFEQLGGFGIHLFLVEDAEKGQAPGIFTAEEDVAGDVEVVAECQVLVDHFDAAAAGVARVADRDFLAVDDDPAAVGDVGAAEDLHEGGLAGGVVADQPQDFSLTQLQVDLVQRLDAAKALGYALHFDDVVAFQGDPPSDRSERRGVGEKKISHSSFN